MAIAEDPWGCPCVLTLLDTMRYRKSLSFAFAFMEEWVAFYLGVSKAEKPPGRMEKQEEKYAQQFAEWKLL